MSCRRWKAQLFAKARATETVSPAHGQSRPRVADRLYREEIRRYRWAELTEQRARTPSETPEEVQRGYAGEFSGEDDLAMNLGGTERMAKLGPRETQECGIGAQYEVPLRRKLMIHNAVATMSEAQEIAAFGCRRMCRSAMPQASPFQLPSAVPPLAGDDPGTIGALSLQRRHLDFVS
jgi:phosphopantetheinyl transferase